MTPACPTRTQEDDWRVDRERVWRRAYRLRRTTIIADGELIAITTRRLPASAIGTSILAALMPFETRICGGVLAGQAFAAFTRSGAEHTHEEAVREVRRAYGKITRKVRCRGQG